MVAVYERNCLRLTGKGANFGGFAALRHPLIDPLRRCDSNALGMLHKCVQILADNL